MTKRLLLGIRKFCEFLFWPQKTDKNRYDDNDRLIVIKSGQQAAWTNVMATNDWIKENIIL